MSNSEYPTNDEDFDPPSTLLDFERPMVSGSYEPTLRSSYEAVPSVGLYNAATDQCEVWEGNTRDMEAMSSASQDALRDDIETKGQAVAVIGRRKPDGSIEIVAGARRLHAIRDLGRTISVELREMDHWEAYLLVEAENIGRRSFSAMEKARYYEHGVKIHGSQAALANALRIDTSNIGRAMSILRLPEELLDKVENTSIISIRQASRFVQDWEVDDETQYRMRVCLGNLRCANAATTFAALNDLIHPPQSEFEIANYEGEMIGHFKNGRTGLKIVLLPIAGSIDPSEIADGIRDVITRIRTSAA